MTLLSIIELSEQLQFIFVHVMLAIAVVDNVKCVSLRVLKVIMATRGKREKKGIQVCLAHQGCLGGQALW